jgi:hypothetical protein
MKFYDHNGSLINHLIKDYQIIYRQQYLPVGWIELSQNRTIKELSIIHENIQIFFGVLIITEEPEPHSHVQYFSLRNKENFDISQDYQHLYNTFHTWGGNFNNKEFLWKKIDWVPDHNDLDPKNIVNIKIINESNNITIREKSKIGLNIIIKKTSIVNYEYRVIKSLEMEENSHEFKEYSNELINNIYKCPDNIIVENIDPQGQKIFIHYCQYLNLHLTENLHINYGFNGKNILLITKDSQEFFNGNSLIKADEVNKIIEYYHYYSQFKYQIKLSVKKYFNMGQWIAISWKGKVYKGIITKSTIEKDNNFWINHITCQCFHNFIKEVAFPTYPKNISVNDDYLEQLWNQWVVLNDKSRILTPILENYYQNIHHKDIVIENI